MSQSFPSAANPLCATFVMEQHIGHYTYYQNLRREIENTPTIKPRWVEVTYKVPGSFFERLPLPRSLRGSLTGRDQVRRGLKDGCQVAFFNTQVPASLAIDTVRRQPYILSTDITPIQYDEMGEQYGHHVESVKLIRRLKHRLNVELFQHAERVLPWSNWAAQSLIKDYGVAAERIEVIAPGVDLDYWQPGRLEHPEGPCRVLFVGGDLYRKGGQTLLDAFHQLPPGCAELILVTRTPFPGEPGVTVYNHLRPNTPELLALYQSSDVFVLPSCAEAFGIAAVEASAAGLPVLASQVGGLQDIVLNGETGYLVQPGDANELAEYLSRLCANPALRRQMGQASRERAQKCFDARKNAARIIEIIFETVA